MLKLRQQRDDRDDAVDLRVESLLAAAAAPTESGPLAGEGAAVAAFHAHRATRGQSTTVGLGLRRAAASAALGVSILLAGGVGGAVAGMLPDAAQDTASDWLSEIGITVPAAGHADDHAERRGSSTDVEHGVNTPHGDRAGKSPIGEAGEVSQMAVDPRASGPENGRAASRVASDDANTAGGSGDADPAGAFRDGDDRLQETAAHAEAQDARKPAAGTPQERHRAVVSRAGSRRP